MIVRSLYNHCMRLFDSMEMAFAERVDRLVGVNPFLPERIEIEKQALGSLYKPESLDWNLSPLATDALYNTNVIVAKIETLLKAKLSFLEKGVRLQESDLSLYRSLVFFFIYHRYLTRFSEAIQRRLTEGSELLSLSFFEEFKKDVALYFAHPQYPALCREESGHLFALAYQVARAFNTIFFYIVGGSAPSAQLRARVWESIFSRNMHEHSRLLFRYLGDITTLITGPSGTGKELVARAIAFSRYIPFDSSNRRFKDDFVRSFFPLNLSALSPALIESELFGHKKGAFTGALSDRMGRLEQCGRYGTVFLDEIGDVDQSIQVKLLRVLEARGFERLGDNKSIRFEGKVIAATNRSLNVEMSEGRFREDLYYRLCADLIETPSLSERLMDCPEELSVLVHHLLQRWLGNESGEVLAEQILEWITRHLGSEYRWPGNVRELDRCVRNIVMHGSYSKQGPPVTLDDAAALAHELREGKLSAEDILNRYCKLVYSACGSYEETGRRLGLDRRTVKSRVKANA